MRRNVLVIAILVIAAALVSAATLPAVAQIKMDMNKITCKDLLKYSSADRTFLQYWMSGYYNAAANNDVLRLQALGSKYRKGSCVLQEEQVADGAERHQQKRQLARVPIELNQCRHCEEPDGATKQSIAPCASPWIASRSLSSGRPLRAGPLARNDGSI